MLTGAPALSAVRAALLGPYRSYDGLTFPGWRWGIEKAGGDKLLDDCEQFSIAAPQLSGMEDVKADIESYMASCAIFEEFVKETPKTLRTSLVKLAKQNGHDLGFLV